VYRWSAREIGWSDAGRWLLLAGILFAAFSVRATLLFEDGFAYPVGSNLAGDAPWAGSSGAAIRVQTGGLTWSGLSDTQPSGNQLQVTGSAGTTLSYGNFSSTPVTNGNVYVAFLFNCAQAPSSTVRVAGLLVGQSDQFNGGSDPLTLLVSNTPSGLAMSINCLGARARAAKLLALNTTHLVVAKFSFLNGGQARLYLDPLTGQSEPATPDALARGGGDDENPIDNLQEIALASPAPAGLVNWSLDTVRVGTQWADVAQWPLPASVSGLLSQTICPGSPAVFTVTALGSTPFAYQWRTNGVMVAGATDSSYTLLNPGSADALVSYSVIVTNAYGSATSGVATLTFRNPASIVVPPASQIVPQGVSNVVFRVTATGTGPLSYQWRAGGVPVAGATRSAWTLTNVTAAAALVTYDVVVANSCDTVTSAPPATLTLPHPFYLADGLPGFFSGMNLFTTNGPGMSLYAWSSADPHVSITNWTLEGTLTEQPLNDGTGNSRYTINVTPATSPVYYLVGQSLSWPYYNPAPVAWITTDNFGNYNLLAATVTIRDDGTLVFPTGPALSGPADQIICSGDAAVFNVVASGTPPLSYQWRVNGQPVANATDSAYVLTKPGAADALANYAVVVADYFGPTTSRVATLTMQTPPKLTLEPSTQVVMPPANSVSFTVAAAGSAPLSYQWRADGLAIAGATASSWAVTNPAAADALKSFDVVVANACGAVTSAPPVQLVFPHSFLPADALPGFFSGENLFTTNSPGMLLYAWSSPDLSLSLTNWTLEGSLSEQPLNDGTGQSRYTINVTPTASPMYYVIGESVAWPYVTPVPVATITTDDLGNYTLQMQTAMVGAEGVLVFPSPPAVSVTPLSQKSSVGKTVSFNATATGTPVLGYQWYFNTGTALAGATGATLTLPGLTAANAGDYAVVVTNAYGSATSAVATLQVAALPVLAAQKSAAGLRLSAGGVPGEIYWVEVATNLAPPVVWRPLGTNVAGLDGLVQFLDAQGANGAPRFYRLGSPAPAAIAPALLQQPAGQLALQGAAVDLTALAAGTPALAYQWYLVLGDGSPAAMAGATNATLSFTNVTGGDSGNYQLVVTNSYGSQTSQVATLTVLAPRILNAVAMSNGIQVSCFAAPGDLYWLQVATNLSPPVTWITIATNLADSRGLVSYLEPLGSLGPRRYYRLFAPPAAIAPPAIVQPQGSATAVLAGKNVSLAAAVSGGPPLAYQWFFNSQTALAGATNLTLALSAVTLAQSGSYILVASNSSGSATSGVSMLTVLPVPQLTAAVASNQLQFSATGVPGDPYYVQMATNLSGPVSWVTVATNYADIDGVVRWVALTNWSGGGQLPISATNGLSQSSRYFRVLSP